MEQSFNIEEKQKKIYMNIINTPLGGHVKQFKF